MSCTQVSWAMSLLSLIGTWHRPWSGMSCKTASSCVAHPMQLSKFCLNRCRKPSTACLPVVYRVQSHEIEKLDSSRLHCNAQLGCSGGFTRHALSTAQVAEPLQAHTKKAETYSVTNHTSGSFSAHPRSVPPGG